MARAVLGRDPRLDEGTPEERIREAEKGLRVRLPAAVRQYYLAAGEADVNRAHNVLLRPEDLRFEQGYLIFMEENQAVVHWGIARADLAQPDPTVWQRVNRDPPEWYSENATFSAFLVTALAPSRGR